jgi:hypothetical protein
VCQKYAVHISFLIQGSQSRTQSTFVDVHSPRNNFCGIRIAVQDTTFFGTRYTVRDTIYVIQGTSRRHNLHGVRLHSTRSRYNLYDTRLLEKHYKCTHAAGTCFRYTLCSVHDCRLARDRGNLTFFEGDSATVSVFMHLSLYNCLLSRYAR